MFGWLTNVFTGFWSFIAPYFGSQKAVLLFVGLENAGKSCLLYRLKEDKMGSPTPSARPTSETLTLGNLTFTTYDLGGHKQARRVWNDYYPAANGIIYLVDGANKKVFEESKTELQHVLSHHELSNVPVAVLVNKIDLPQCVSSEEIICTFDLYHLVTGKDVKNRAALKGKRPLEVFPISVLKQQGYGTAFEWIANFTKPIDE